MANTLTNLIPTLYKALDVVSRELVGFIPAVSRDSTVESVALNQTVNVPVVGANSAADITPGQTAPNTGDITPGNVEVTISKSRGVPIRWNGEEQKAVDHTGIYGSIHQQRFEQAFRTLTNEVESDIAGLNIFASRAFGTAGTTPFATANELDDFSETERILDENGAPGDRHHVLNSAAIAKIRGFQSGLLHKNEAGNDNLLRRGEVGDIFSAKVHASGQVASHTAGTAASATTDDSGYAIGATVITLASAGTGTILAGDALTFAGDTNKYLIVSGDADVSGGGTITIAEPGLKVAMSAATKAITMIATSVRNMAFSRSAIVLATRMPAMPKEGDAADDVFVLTDPVSGLSFEVALYKEYRQVHFQVGLAWGFKMIAPRHCSILLG